MNPVDKARMIALEAIQLADNVGKWVQEQPKQGDYSVICVNIGNGGSWSAIQADIVKIRRDLISLRNSLPELAYEKLGDTNEQG